MIEDISGALGGGISNVGTELASAVPAVTDVVGLLPASLAVTAADAFASV